MKKSLWLTSLTFRAEKRQGHKFTRDDVINTLREYIACQADWRTAKPTQEQLDKLFAEIGC